MGRLLLLRHCQAAWLEDNESRPLSELGLEQAEQLDASLRRWPIDGIVSSPYRRAIDTISPLASALELEIELDERLREREAPFLAAAADHIAAAEACFADHLLRLEGAETGERGRDGACLRPIRAQSSAPAIRFRGPPPLRGGPPAPTRARRSSQCGASDPVLSSS